MNSHIEKREKREKRIHARKCRVLEIDANLAKEFVSQNHRQGATGGTVKIKSVGLYLDEELVGVAQFCSPRTDRKSVV